MFDADRPIAKISQDRLNRSVFAKYLARSMLDHQDPNSLVIGLYGGFGVGKTSIINMVAEELAMASANTENPEKPIVLNFSPWSYSGQNQLIYSFFRRLSSAIRQVDYLDHAEEIINLLELYASFFTLKPTPKPFQMPDGENFAWDSGRDLTDVKAKLNALLGEQKHKIIVIIDNLSRLDYQEVKQIFQIIKSMADYTNTIYLLAMDKEQVLHSLNQSGILDSEQFLDKVIQLPFFVPPISSQDIEIILSDRLSDVIKLIPDHAWDAAQWSDVYDNSLRKFFHHCRDITRYINTLSFSYMRLRDVVNPVDFFALTAIEVFEPDVYVGIRDNKDLFSDLFDHVYTLSPLAIEKDKARCDEIIARSQHISDESMLELLLSLFPRLRKIYEPHIDFYYSAAKARTLKHISSPDLFDAYFRLSIHPSILSSSEFFTILSSATSHEIFDRALTRLNQDENRITQFLNQLDSKVIPNINPNNISPIIDALIDNGDLFPAGTNGPLQLSTPMHIHRIIYQLLSRVSDKEERLRFLQQAFEKSTKSLYIIIHEINELQKEQLSESENFLPEEWRLFTEEQLMTLRQVALVKISLWAKDKRLIEHPKLLPILFAWCHYGQKRLCQQYIETVTLDDHGLLAFLQAALAPAIIQTATYYEKSPGWENFLSNISYFIDPNELEEHARLFLANGQFETLREREQLALMIFLDLIQQETNPLPPLH